MRARLLLPRARSAPPRNSSTGSGSGRGLLSEHRCGTAPRAGSTRHRRRVTCRRGRPRVESGRWLPCRARARRLRDSAADDSGPKKHRSLGRPRSYLQPRGGSPSSIRPMRVPVSAPGGRSSAFRSGSRTSQSAPRETPSELSSPVSRLSSRRVRHSASLTTDSRHRAPPKGAGLLETLYPQPQAESRLAVGPEPLRCRGQGQAAHWLSERMLYRRRRNDFPFSSDCLSCNPS